MKRIVVVLPLNISNRFVKDLRRVFEIGLMDRGIEAVFVDSGYESVAEGNDFTDMYMHMLHDAVVLQKLLPVIREWRDDVVPVFWYDVFFTGVLGGSVAVLNMVAERLGKKVINIGYVHGGVWCDEDIYHEARYPMFVGMRDISFMLGMEKIYTGSHHHKRQILGFARKITKSYYAELLNSIVDVNPLPHMVRVKRSEKDIDVFIPHSRYMYGRGELLLYADELRRRGYNVYVADRYLGDRYIDLLGRSKVVIICKSHETYGVAETEAIYNYALPYCPIDCESKQVMEDVHLQLYKTVYEEVGDDLESLLKNYDVVRDKITGYLRMISDNCRWIGMDALIHNTRFFDSLVRDVGEIAGWL